MGKTDVLSMLTDKRLDFYYKLNVLLKLVHRHFLVYGNNMCYVFYCFPVGFSRPQLPVSFSTFKGQSLSKCGHVGGRKMLLVYGGSLFDLTYCMSLSAVSVWGLLCV